MSVPIWLRRLGAVVLILFAMELVARIAIAPLDIPAFTSSPDGRDLSLIPGAQGRVHIYGRTIEVSVDAEGRRTTVGEPAKGCGSHRLDLIGDSQVFGWGLGDAETFGSQLQARLGPGWRVVNHGIPGTGPLQYARVLQSVPQDAEVLMVFTEVNDLWDTYGLARHPTRCGYMTEAAWPQSSLVCPLLNSRAVQLGFAAYDKLTEQRALAPIGFDPSSGVAARILAQHVRSMFVRGDVRVHPHLHFAVLPWDGRFNPHVLPDYFPSPNPNTPRYFEDEYDLISAFAHAADPTALYLPRDPHLSPRGAALFAERVAPAFAALAKDVDAIPAMAECAE